MQRRELPSGYIEAISAHNDPLQPEPPPPIIQRKEAQTLMGHCLKQFIRERLYGNLVNYSRQKQHINPSSPPHTLLPNIKPSHISTPTILLTNEALRRQATQRYSSYAKTSAGGTAKGQPLATNRNNRSSLSSLQHSLLQRSKVLLQRGKMNPHRASLPSNNLSHNQPTSLSRSRENSLNNSQDPYQISSFLSAVEDLSTRNQLVHLRRQKKLSPLVASLDINDKLQKIKPSKKTTATDRFTLDMSIWDSFCRKEIPSQNSQLTDDLTQRTTLAKSTLKANLGLAGGQKSKVFNTKSNFSRQNFLNYLNNLLLVAPLLPEQAFQFFQLGNKISDNITVEDYKGIVEKLATAGPRLWSVLAFRFWDVDQNGLIDSNDIFQMYKKLDQINVQLNERADDKPGRGLIMVNNLLKELQILRQKINTLDLQRKLAISTQTAEPPNSQGMYLQESLIRKKELSYSQLQLVLGQNLKQDGKDQKHSVIQSAKDLGIKFSSCYRYSFMATDHNQETRENREYIERMKEGLKKQKGTSDKHKEILIQQPLPAINYSTFVANGYFAPIKSLVLEIFAMQLPYK